MGKIKEENIVYFTILEDSQLYKFFSRLIGNNKLTLNEINAFKELYGALCTDFDGYGNDIFFLKEGRFLLYDEGGVKVAIEKKKAFNTSGRVNAVYRSSEGDLYIKQSLGNKKMYNVYLSDKLSERLVNVFNDANIETLDLRSNVKGIRRIGKVKSYGKK